MNSLNEGKYIVDIELMQKDSNELSEIANYLAKRAIITKEQNILTMTLLVLDNGSILGLQLEGNNEWVEADLYNVDDETNRRYELFELDHLTEIISARAQYEYNYEGRIMKADEELKLAIDQSSIEVVD